MLNLIYVKFRLESSRFMQRNLPESIRETSPDVSSQDGLEIKVCVRTYRLFYVSQSEDFIWKYRSREEAAGNSQQLHRQNELRRKWIDKSKGLTDQVLGTI